MGIFSFFKNKEKSELVLVFDIGTSFVRGALLEVQKSGTPKIIFTAYESVIILEEMNVDQFFSLTIKSISVVARKILMSGLGSPTKIFCVLSTLWYMSQTRVIQLSKNTPFIFSHKLADTLIQKEINIFEQEHIDKYASMGLKVLPIELKNMKTVLNGYETPKPLNQKARDLEMTIFVAVSSEAFIKKVQEVSISNFHRHDLKFSSNSMVSFAVIRDMFPNVESFLLVDIDAEITHIALVKLGILSESVSFPMGRNFMIRGLARELSSTLDETNSLLSLYTEGHADENTIRKIEPVLNKLKNEWLRKFQESLANLSNDISIPSTIYMSVEESLVDFFRKTIESEQFSQYSFTESKFKIIVLDAQILHDSVKFKGENYNSNSLPLMLDAIYINRFLI